MEPSEPQFGIAAEEDAGRHRNPASTAGGNAVGTAGIAKSASLGWSFCFASLVVLVGLILNPSHSFAWQRLAAMPRSAPNWSPLMHKGASGSVMELIELLDSPAFSQRQSATESIIEHGASALPDLSQRFFASSPETNYRIRKSLEGIAADGDEETFLKSSAILLTLYSNGNDQIFEQIKELKKQWQAQRTEMAIEALKRTGAEVVLQKGYNAQFGQRAINLNSRGAILSSDNPRVDFVKRTVAQQKEMVDTILTSDAESNRDFIFELMPAKSNFGPTISVGAMNPNQLHLAGTRIKFPADWAAKNPDAGALKELRQIDDRLYVEFSSTNLSNAQWETLTATENIVSLDLVAPNKTVEIPKTLPSSLHVLNLSGFEVGNGFVETIQPIKQLQQVQFTNCKFEERSAEKIASVKSIKSVVCQFENRTLDAAVVLAMAEFDDLRAVHLTGVEFSDGALENLRKLSNVTLLYVTDMPATAPFFQNVGKMPKLNNIQFRGSKINIPAYKQLASGQRVRMNFEAQAFLGIQGGPARNGRGVGPDALVTMVVPESAAEVGGIQAGDLISKIDGEKVMDFNDVRLHITQYTAGDDVAIEVLRDGKPVPLSVKLRDYKTARKF